jgi:2-methylaconitate cis-trans-isomerase PrpF
VLLDQPRIDYSGNCGNISSAVGPFAIDEGFVEAKEPLTVVRIHQVNTRKVIVAEVQVRGKKSEVEGDYAIPGVPGTGAKILLDFSDQAGAITGKLLPTGNVSDVLRVEGEGDFEVSLVDAGNPMVFMKATDFGLTCTETPLEIDANAKLLVRIEKVRSYAAQAMGLVNDWKKATTDSAYLPMVGICATPASFKIWPTGEQVDKDTFDLNARLILLQKTHKAYAGTGIVCTAAAAMMPGSVVNQLSRPGIIERGELRLGHPQGVMDSKCKVDRENGAFVLKKATFNRTARCLMKGYAFIPKSVAQGNT